MKYSNYHTHTIFCDGSDSPEELVEYALELGCPEIGFSGHGYTYFDTAWCMSKEGTEAYRECITGLKEKYRSKIKILLGIEQDLWSDTPAIGYDFIIGGVHYIKHKDAFLPVDESAALTKQQVEKYYGGDFLSYCEDYYKNAAMLYEKTKCNIIAHFDLVTKFNEQDALFDSSCQRYRTAAAKALDILCKHPVCFEINTGAISRGYRTDAYPSAELISMIKDRNRPLMLSSDCHAKKNLLFKFDDYAKFL